MKILGIDYGRKRVGYATGSLETKIAFAGGVIENRGIETLVKEFLKLADELGAEKVVLGLPLAMEEGQEENYVMPDVKEFVALWQEESEVPIELFDERLSSFEADELMDEIDSKIGDREKLGRDAYAAQVILQRFFDESRG